MMTMTDDNCEKYERTYVAGKYAVVIQLFGSQMKLAKHMFWLGVSDNVQPPMTLSVKE